MGRKPSMFSRNYRRQLRNRRLKLAGVISTVIILLTLVFYGGTFKAMLTNIKTSLNSMNEKTNNDKKSEVDKNDTNIDNDNIKDEVEVEPKEENFEVKLNSGLIINLKYTIEGEKKIFNETLVNEKVFYSVSQNKEKVVVLDKNSQEAYIIDINKEVTNFNKKEYVSTKNEIFKRENVISRIENYIWIDTPTFMDDKHIAYVSNLPWINNSGTKYLWIYDVSSGEHMGYYKIKGNDLKLGKMTQTGLMIYVDGKEMFVDVNGIIVK